MTYFMKNYGHHIKCPVAGCEGFYTTSGRANIGNHIRNKAKTELLKNYILNGDYKMPHADFIKKHAQGATVQEAIMFKVGGKVFVITG